MRKRNYIILGFFFLTVLIISVGYSKFATQLTLNGTAKIVGEWDIRITNIEATQIAEGCDAGTPSFTNTTATFNAKLVKPGDKITYQITIENKGTIDAVLETIIFKQTQDEESPELSFQTSELSHILEAGSKTTFTVTMTYDGKTTENPTTKSKSIIGIIEYAQK